MEEDGSSVLGEVIGGKPEDSSNGYGGGISEDWPLYQMNPREGGSTAERNTSIKGGEGSGVMGK